MSINKKIIKEKIYQLLFGLIMIPVIFTFLTILIGALINFIKDSEHQFSLINYWKSAIQLQYVWLLSLLLSLCTYIYYGFKICQTKKNQATIKKTKQKEYGQARWASEKELNKNYPLISNKKGSQEHGFVVNAKQKKIKGKNHLKFNVRTNTHSLVIGGTGSGKTQNLVLPTININSKSLAKPSMIITDPKGELDQEQKILLQKEGYQVLELNLRNVTLSIAWNPLATIYQQFKAMILTNNQQEELKLRVQIQTDIQDLTKTLFSIKNQEDPFWANSGALIVQAIIMAILEDTESIIKEAKNDKLTILEQVLPIKKFNLASVTIIASMQEEMIDWFKQRDDTSLAKITANQVLLGESKTLNSVLMTISTYLSIFKNDFIRNLTCNNDLNFDDFITKPTALFIIIPDENYNYYVFVSLLISQLYKFLVNQANNNDNKKLTRPVYFLCDEFGNLPPITNLDAIITVARSRNIFFQLILQDLQQLTNKYGKEKANIIFSNCSLHIFLQTIDWTTAERYSKMIGDTTVIQIATNTSEGKTKNKSESLTGHRLILASDLMKLALNQAIIFYAREHPVRTKLIAWHQVKKEFPQEVIQPINTKKLALINFNQDYYYDIKNNQQLKSIIKTKKNNNKKPIKQENRTKLNLESQTSIKGEILRLEAKLTEYYDNGSIEYKEFITTVKQQIKFYQKILQNLKKKNSHD